MAVTVYCRDLVNYPGVQKTITVDLSQLVPVGSTADEKWLISCSTSAYSNNTNRTAIQSIYINQLYRGWSKSSGLVGSTFTISGSVNDTLTVNIDNASGTYSITLSAGTNLTGEDVADDIQEKIRALSNTGGTQAGNLSYRAAVCEWKNNKFWVYSGSIEDSYSNATRTSVQITGGTASSTLGFDKGLDSYIVASNPPKVVSVASTVNPGASSVSVTTGLGTVASGQACLLYDGTKSEAFVLLGTSTETVLQTSNTISGSYAAGSRVMRLSQTDWDYPTPSSFRSVDDTVRWALESLITQIDFSS